MIYLADSTKIYNKRVVLVLFIPPCPVSVDMTNQANHLKFRNLTSSRNGLVCYYKHHSNGFLVCFIVNEEWVPLVSSTCACHMDSAPEDLILFTPFTAQCVKVGFPDFSANGRHLIYFTDYTVDVMDVSLTCKCSRIAGVIL